MDLSAAVVGDVTPAGSMEAMLVLRDNFRFRREIENQYLRAIGRARREVLIANAYFFPGRRMRQALKAAAASGVRVRLLLQGRVEYRLQHWASQAMYDELLRAGIEIVEYRPSFLHAKVAVIDDWATVGSSNIDPFSLLLAREANVVVEDAGFAAQLRRRIVAAIEEGGVPVARSRHAVRAWPMRLVHGMSYLLLRLGVAISGAGADY
jgi:cardiolipin synthase